MANKLIASPTFETNDVIIIRKTDPIPLGWKIATPEEVVSLYQRNQEFASKLDSGEKILTLQPKLRKSEEVSLYYSLYGDRFTISAGDNKAAKLVLTKIIGTEGLPKPTIITKERTKTKIAIERENFMNIITTEMVEFKDKVADLVNNNKMSESQKAEIFINEAPFGTRQYNGVIFGYKNYYGIETSSDPELSIKKIISMNEAVLFMHNVGLKSVRRTVRLFKYLKENIDPLKDGRLIPEINVGEKIENKILAISVRILRQNKISVSATNLGILLRKLSNRADTENWADATNPSSDSKTEAIDNK